ncbi:RNA polymerase sigma-70 factor [Chitinophaga silvatica]|uniref:RNA polymerase sigma-70 factor n=1 Tax=Chitinophaga silvatica TaxID=2282649 RepID=UPI00131420E7|nr:RNA polymerase sigma-70 factor [Chitinophaga silvatica]
MQHLLTSSVDLQEVAAGNEKAFKILFEQYRGKLFNYISRFVKSETIAEELVLDVFMKIWIGRDLIAQVRNFDAFLFRIAHNKSIDFLRSAAGDKRLQELLWDKIDLADQIGADTGLMAQEYESKIRAAIALLPPQCKKVYTLSREEELSHDQIAQQLNISRATVNNHIVMAQRFIRNFLSKEIDLAIVILLLGKI